MAMVCTLGFFTALAAMMTMTRRDLYATRRLRGTWKVQEAGMDPTTYQATGSIVLN